MYSTVRSRYRTWH